MARLLKYLCLQCKYAINIQRIIEGVLNGDRILNFMDSFTVVSAADNLTAKVSFSYLVNI